jgi:hypothetical protein
VGAGFVTPRYFNLLRIPLLQGRIWDEAEGSRPAHLVVINETMARRYWPHESPLHRQIRLPQLLPHPPQGLSAPGSDSWMEVIGVVGDVRNNGTDNPVEPGVYLPYGFHVGMFGQILIRARGNPLALLRSLQDRVRDVDSEQQITAGVRTLDGFIATQDYWEQQRTVTILFSLFSAAALLLAGVGFHSVLSCSVAQRSREFAVRMALGAQRGQIMAALFLSTALVTAIGLIAGTLLYMFAIRIIAHWSRIHIGSPAMVFAVMPLVLLLAAVASYIPARRVVRIDPIECLRQG